MLGSGPMTMFSLQVLAYFDLSPPNLKSAVAGFALEP
jgi:hypothetical protein